MKRLLIALFFYFSLSTILVAQLRPIGTWTGHFPFIKGKGLLLNDDKLYCATASGVFTYNLKDNSIETFSKINGLNDVNISLIGFSKKYNTLIITYDNGNIDLLKKGNLINIPFLKLSNEGATQPNELKIKDEIAYIAYDFGIMLVNLEKEEIKETINLSNSGGGNIAINSTQIIDNNIFAATKNGFFKASVNSNLLDFGSWQKQSSFSSSNIKSLININDQLGLVIPSDSNSIYFQNDSGQFVRSTDLSGRAFKSLVKRENEQFDVYLENKYLLLDSLGNVLEEKEINFSEIIKAIRIGELLYVLKRSAPLEVIDLSTTGVIELIRPNGPADNSIFDMVVSSNGELWTSNGGHDASFNNAFRFSVLQHFKDGEWKVFTTFNNSDLSGIFDVVRIVPKPDNPNFVFFNTWGNGIIQLKPNFEFKVLTDTNTNNVLSERDQRKGWIGSGDGVFDQDGNYWVTRPFTRQSLAVRKKDGSWRSFDFSDLISNDETAILDLEISDEGHKWFALPRETSIIVFDDNGTIDNTSDDRAIRLNSGDGNGGIPGNRLTKIEKDKNGLIWIGTSDGIAVHFNPGNIFDAANRDFDRLVFFDGENNEIVLKNTIINDLVVDGANRKWIGTENSGIIVLSQDGKETELEFNESNSPLPSNAINSIAIDDQSGEVYISTSNGLVSYRSEVVNGSENLSNIKVFPNPIRPDYTGPITISGLRDNTTVKITDVQGKLVNEFKSQGGSIIWDGNQMNGSRVASGVYLILSSSPDGLDEVETSTEKILFLN